MSEARAWARRLSCERAEACAAGAFLQGACGREESIDAHLGCSFGWSSRSSAVHAACFCHACCRFIWIGAGDRQLDGPRGRHGRRGEMLESTHLGRVRGGGGQERGLQLLARQVSVGRVRWCAGVSARGWQEERGAPVSGLPTQSCGLHAFSWALVDSVQAGEACSCLHATGVKTLFNNRFLASSCGCGVVPTRARCQTRCSGRFLSSSSVTPSSCFCASGGP